jgi:hypothetical protein
MLRHYAGKMSGCKFVAEEETSIMTDKIMKTGRVCSVSAVCDECPADETITVENFDKVPPRVGKWLHHISRLLCELF